MAAVATKWIVIAAALAVAITACGGGSETSGSTALPSAPNTSEASRPSSQPDQAPAANPPLPAAAAAMEPVTTFGELTWTLQEVEPDGLGWTDPDHLGALGPW